MRICSGAQHAADHHLRGGKAFAQHVHERNGAALADVTAGRAKVRLRGLVERLLEPGRGGRAFQPVAPPPLWKVTLAW